MKDFGGEGRGGDTLHFIGLCGAKRRRAELAEEQQHKKGPL